MCVSRPPEASGTFQQAQAMLDAGADRIGASALVGLFQQEG